MEIFRKYFLLLSFCFACVTIVAGTKEGVKSYIPVPDILEMDSVSIFVEPAAKPTMPSTPTTPSIPKISIARLISKADSLRLEYDFDEAVLTLEQAKKLFPDSVSYIDTCSSMLMSQNAKNMLDYCSRPVVVAKQKFSIKDFYLFYPLSENSWRPLPNKLDTLADGDFPNAVYIPDDAKTIYYSAKDTDGIRNIYKTDYHDSIWSVPSLVNEQITSLSCEIYPMLSEDGKSLYFSSKGLYGMGGYDIYVSNWNKEINDWDVPVNMGFPYSSPYDDFLFVNTPDGRYSMFASNRETSPDSVFIYVLEYDRMPVRKSISDKRELLKIVSLDPIADPSRIDNVSAVSGNLPENKDTRLYANKMNQVRSLRNMIDSKRNSIEESKQGLTEASEADKKEIVAAIMKKEAILKELQDSLATAINQLQKIEMEFLSSGIMIDLQKMQEEADREVVGASTGYTFSRNSMGSSFNMKVAVPKAESDYSFNILPEGRFAEDNSLPKGLIYQIQLFSSSSKVEESRLNGLSPVFWRMSPSLKYTYSVGLFSKYEDVLANLNKVKKAGFKNALIVAFNDGRLITLQKAKEIENAGEHYCRLP